MKLSIPTRPSDINVYFSSAPIRNSPLYPCQASRSVCDSMAISLMANGYLALAVGRLFGRSVALFLANHQVIGPDPGAHNGPHERWVAKLIPTNSRIEVNHAVIQSFLQPFPDGSRLYRHLWQDVEGYAILMSEWPQTLRQMIGPNHHFSEEAWLIVMLAIATRLDFAHTVIGIPHGDMCASNGKFPAA
jgi:hypothetical protein